ncbi:aromatic ring-hydroxylating dioxygenase subunit alpha [Catenulispora sp. NL8]|uniref:Aromatic ring-hydroxylating dioxygenase subunit alpha n=1 Tax=Catenulispora pinistramenti TaxID=2705254 RepID=A0ABS5KMC8_9ACTN|nr:aromatic ring-hydroxylating dioxygenase subunit alpha [Catenulispora pinistramenti]MBS2547164.1 aromatic ring-hydroxylating dioxygenase subunit alpha [Catenulispora pinistramenti]
MANQTYIRGLIEQESRSTDPLLDWWHPVGWSADFGEQPTQVVLLGRALAVWRDADGAARCFRDLCVHRGTALSLGKVSDGKLACAYHGWTYDGRGKCLAIPQLAADAPVPASARALVFACEERYGLVWVCLGTPRAPIPDFPEWDAPGFRHAACPPYAWQCAAPRMVENFTDFGHLGWLHDGLLGSRDDLEVPDHAVQTEDGTLRYSLTMRVPAAEGINDLSGPNGLMTNDYVLSLPHAIHLRSRYHDTGRSRVLFFAVRPDSATVSTGFCYQSRDFDLDGDDRRYVEFQETLAEQDRVVVESQRPEELPLDLADELHLKFDRVAVAYRKALSAYGLLT